MKMPEWSWKQFSDLTTLELYELLKLREAVFVVEQNCVYTDIDDRDQLALHLLGWQKTRLIAYLRVLLEDNVVTIGRVVIAKTARCQGAGRAIMENCLAYLQQHFPNATLKLSSQCVASEFYAGFGFHKVGGSYDEDGILHVMMIREPEVEVA